MSDIKPNKLIIPKVKITPTTENKNNSQQSNERKKTHQPTNKNQNLLFNHRPEFNTPSNRKNFPKEEDLEKMSKKQLAQTYFDQLMRLRRQNQVLDKQLAYVRQQRDQLYKRYNELKEQQRMSDDERPKRQRRMANDIERNYRCPVGNCDKSYGSQGSLIQHIKLKHEQFYNTEQYYSYLNRKKQQQQQ